MRQMRLRYPIPLLSRILRVSASGFYTWTNRPPSEWVKEETRLEVAIRAAHKRARQTYGAERLQRELADDGITVGVCRIKRIKRKLGLRCKQKRKFKATTDSRHKLPVAENLLKQQFKAYEPYSVWVSDITYVRLALSGRAQGPLYQ
jgi:putative transposase